MLIAYCLLLTISGFLPPVLLLRLTLPLRRTASFSLRLWTRLLLTLRSHLLLSLRPHLLRRSFSFRLLPYLLLSRSRHHSWLSLRLLILSRRFPLARLRWWLRPHHLLLLRVTNGWLLRPLYFYLAALLTLSLGLLLRCRAA